jgi:uncharacterized protein (TIGR00725 family)
MTPRPVLAVCGANAITDPAVSALARELGAQIARVGATLICGGGGGVMEAASRGFEEARGAEAPRGVVVALLPGRDRAGLVGFADLVIPTGMGYARNVILTLAADAVILVGGGSGTLSEAALAWQHGKPLVALAPSGGWAERLAGTALDDRRSDRVLAAATPAEAVRLALAAAGGSAAGSGP